MAIFLIKSCFLKDMTTLEFQDFRFIEDDENIEVNFLKIFTFNIKKSDLTKIGEFSIDKNSISFPNVKEDKVERAFSKILNKKFLNLKNKLNNNPVLYIHKNSGIPLIGSLSFGIVDKGTDMLELKPITSCNIDCIFCSVDEGHSSKKQLDIVIEKNYLVQETKKVLEFKKQPVHIYINPHGEPLLYADIVDLVKELSKIEYVKAISLITNATLLTKELAEQLISAGLTEFNISLNALESNRAREISNSKNYNIDKIKQILAKIKGKIKVIIAPVLVNKVNNNDIEGLIEYCKDNDFELLIQNFMLNRRGRKPAKELPFPKFYEYLKNLEEKYKIQLIKQQGEIIKTKELPKPFKKGDIIKTEIFSRGRYSDESLAKANGRIITVKYPFNKNGIVKIKITKDRYNLFYGTL